MTTTNAPIPAELALLTPVAADASTDVLTTRAPLLTLADLRFFVTCYLAGLVFFLVMLS